MFTSLGDARGYGRAPGGVFFLERCCRIVQRFPIWGRLPPRTAVFSASNTADDELGFLFDFRDDGDGCAVEACLFFFPLQACSLVDPPTDIFVADVFYLGETSQSSAA